MIVTANHISAVQQGINFQSPVASVSDLPPSAQTGTMVMVQDTGAMYIWDGTSWAMVAGALSWNLFLDDLRDPVSAMFDGADTFVARSADEAMDLVRRKGLPKTMSLDHDLGPEDRNTGFHFLWSLINGHLDGEWDLSAITLVQVHSQNPEGVKKISSLWNCFCEQHGIEDRSCNILPAYEPK